MEKLDFEKKFLTTIVRKLIWIHQTSVKWYPKIAKVHGRIFKRKINFCQRSQICFAKLQQNIDQWKYQLRIVLFKLWLNLNDVQRSQTFYHLFSFFFHSQIILFSIAHHKTKDLSKHFLNLSCTIPRPVSIPQFRTAAKKTMSYKKKKGRRSQRTMAPGWMWLIEWTKMLIKRGKS